jgi:Zn-dependent protease with chaperone function
VIEIPAHYFDGESARQIDAVVRISLENIVVRDGTGAVLAVWPADEVRLVSKPDYTQPLRLGRGKGVARIVIDDSRHLTELERLYPELHRLRPRFREVWRPIALWSTVAVASLAFLFMVALPFAAREAAEAIPPDIEAQIGEAAAEQVVRLFSPGREAVYCSSPEGDAALQALTQRFSQQLDLPFPLTVRVVKSPLVNAFTLPGGQVLLLSELLNFAESPEEVAGILAHEIGHALHRHPMEVFVKNVGSATLIGFLLGDVTGGSIIVALAQFTVNSAYTREAELEADTEAVELLNGAGIDGDGLVDFFDRIQARSGKLGEVLAVIGTHPATDERADFVRNNEAASGAALTDAQWRALKEICGDDD